MTGPDDVPSAAHRADGRSARRSASPLRQAQDSDGDFRSLLLDSIGGWRGMVDSGLPVVVFVIVNVLTALSTAIWAAIGTAAALIAVRAVRRENVQQAISGAFGVGIAALIAWRMGEARGFFLLGIWRNFAFGAIFAVSILIRRPLVGLIWEYLEGNGTTWRSQRRLLLTYTWATLLWAAVFFARFVVGEFFYRRNATGWLAGTSLAMGYPLWGVALAITVLLVRRAGRERQPDPTEPDTDSADATGPTTETAPSIQTRTAGADQATPAGDRHLGG